MYNTLLQEVIMAKKSEIRQICDDALTQAGFNSKVDFVYNDRNKNVRRLKYIRALTNKISCSSTPSQRDKAIAKIQKQVNKQGKYGIIVSLYGMYSVTFHVHYLEQR